MQQINLNQANYPQELVDRIKTTKKRLITLVNLLKQFFFVYTVIFILSIQAVRSHIDSITAGAIFLPFAMLTTLGYASSRSTLMLIKRSHLPKNLKKVKKSLRGLHAISCVIMITLIIVALGYGIYEYDFHGKDEDFLENYCLLMIYLSPLFLPFPLVSLVYLKFVRRWVGELGEIESEGKGWESYGQSFTSIEDSFGSGEFEGAEGFSGDDFEVLMGGKEVGKAWKLISDE